jgi:hypothetical protein
MHNQKHRNNEVREHGGLRVWHCRRWEKFWLCSTKMKSYKLVLTPSGWFSTVGFRISRFCNELQTHETAVALQIGRARVDTPDLQSNSCTVGGTATPAL